MPRLDRLPEKQRAVLRAQAVASYDTSPATPLPVPLAQARVAVVTTAGLHLRGDRAFEREDPGFREIPSTAEAQDLVQSHASIGFDRTAFQRDVNVVFPLDRLRELAAARTIGELAPRFLSFMGAQTDPSHTLTDAAADAAALLRSDQVHLALLTPT